MILKKRNKKPGLSRNKCQGKTGPLTADVLLLFVCLVMNIHFSPYCTDPSVYPYISDDRIPKHTISAMFCTSHSCFKELIFFIFFSLVLIQS